MKTSIVLGLLVSVGFLSGCATSGNSANTNSQGTHSFTSTTYQPLMPTQQQQQQLQMQRSVYQ